MSSKENLTEHQSRSIQKGNYVTALNSEEHIGTPTYKGKFSQLLEKRNWLENAQEPAECLSNNSQPSTTSVITQVFHVPLEENEYVNQFGKDRQGKFYLDIMQKTGANVELIFVKDQGLYIIVSGETETVMKAQKEIFTWFQDRGLTAVSIPEEQPCFVTGKTGGEMQDLEEKDATYIQNLCPDNHSNWINTVGIKEVMKKDLHEVLGMSTDQDKCAVEKLDEKKAFFPSTPGPSSKTFDKIIPETEAHIHVPPPSVDQTQVGFTEKKQQLNEAQACVKEIFDSTKKKNTPINAEMKFQHKCTIGPKRNSVQETLPRSGISIEILPVESMSASVTEQGEPGSSGKAFSKASSKTERYTVSSIFVPSWLHRFIIGKKGCNISEITHSMPKVHIEFTEGDKITIKGPKEDVNDAQEQIEVIVKDLINRMDYAEINVDCKFHKHLIGKNDAIIKQIKERNNVSVLMSPKNVKNKLIRIEGESQGVQQAKRELLELAGHLENEHSKDLIIEQRFHPAIIGWKGERIHDIQKKFPEVMIHFPDQAQKSDTVQLRGPKHEIEKCTQYLENVVADIVESSYSVTIPNFKKPHRNVNGEGGANIKKICAASNTKSNPPSASGYSEDIVISGKPANCEVASNWILPTQKHITNSSEVEISIPSNLYKSLTDSKDCLIGAIMQECGRIHIHFPKMDSGLQRVIIRGPAQSVEKAKTKLLQLAEEEQTKSHTVILHVKPQYHKFLMNKNGGNVSKVCNETGAHIIFPIPEDKDQELLTIKGTEKAVKDAQKGLAALITNLDNIVEEDILINPVYHHHFFMRRGPVFREITEEYGGVSINFSYSGKQRSKVTIKGAKPCVEAAKKHIQEITGDLDSQVTTECIIPQKFHHFIMGQMCSRIQQITRDYNVQIKFPDKENSVTNMDPTIQKNEEEVREKSTTEAASISPRKCDTILISGQKEECAAAMEALEALIPVTAELDVPFDLHHYIIGQKRREIRKIMDRFEVNIHMSTPGLASDILFITGLAANVEQAKARLQELVKALQNEAKDRALRNFKLKFTVDPKYHPKIIGHKGVVITQICLKHKVAIHFPRKGSDETQDQITITGYENNTIAAQNAIMKLVHKFEKKGLLSKSQ